MPSSETAQILRFGVFEVDLRSGELRRNGLKVKLQGQPFQVLAMLLERPGDLVTRDDLRLKLWPADTFVDFEHSLNAAIKRLRDALNDSAEKPVFIETLPRRGYRFLIPVSRNGTPSAESPTARITLVGRATERSMRSLFMITGFAGLILISYFVQRLWSIRSARATVALPPMKVVPFTTSPGAEMRPKFSPDGKQIAFISEGENATTADLYVKLIGGENPLKLAEGVGIESVPAWSPDGRYIAFGRCAGGCGTSIVPTLGGAERKVADEGGCGGLGLSWSPDGKLLTFAHKLSSNDLWSIFLFDIDTHEHKKLTFPPAHTIGDHIPAFSPDGRHIAFRRVSSPGVTDVYVVPVQGGEPHRITFDGTFVGDLTWAADNKTIIFSSSRLGTAGLWRVPAAGGLIEPIASAGPRAGSPSVSSQGNRLAYASGDLHGEIWQMELNKPGKPRAPAAFSSSWGEDGPHFSPDGKKIVYYSSRSGTYFELWTVNSDGSNPVQLTSFGVLSGTPRWSPDGRYIVFDSRRGNRSQIFVIAGEGGPVRQVTSGDFENSVPNWSRNGEWIYFGSNRSDGWQLWKVSSSGGDPIRVTKNHGFFAIESPDGKYIYYAKEDPDGIWQIPTNGGDEERILNVQLASWGDWAVLDKGIYFLNREGPGRRASIRFYSFASHMISVLAKVDKAIPPEMPDFDVSPDGKIALYGQVAKSVDIMLVENFQ